MHIFKSLLFMTATALISTPVIAWEHTITRGLDLYSTTENGATIRVVCDPNRVYGGTETMVLIVVDGNSDLNTSATLVFPNGESITAQLVHGRLSKRDLENTVWHPLLESLRQTSNVDLTINESTQSVALGEPVEFTCL